MVIMGATIGGVCHSLTCQRHGHDGFQDLAGVLGKRRQLLSNWWYEELVDVFELTSVILKQSHFGYREFAIANSGNASRFCCCAGVIGAGNV